MPTTPKHPNTRHRDDSADEDGTTWTDTSGSSSSSAR